MLTSLKMISHLAKINKVNLEMKKTLFIIIPLLISLHIAAQEIPEPMQPPRMVNDYSGLLETTGRERLEAKLQQFYFETSTQIYIVVLDNISDYDIAEYTFLLGDKWGVGTKGSDNGAVILLNPSPDHMRGDVFIATGYGLEGAIPDAIGKRIVEYDMIPSFKQQDYIGGLEAATTSMMDLSRGEYTADQYLQQRQAQRSPGSNIPALGVMIFIVILFSIAGRGRSARQYAMGHKIPFLLALFMVSSSRGSHRGGFGNFSSGGGSFGGGGFGGGGSFGGGGAGGSW
jgi:uncharacterized protein